MLDALLKEFGASFPEFKRVLIDERDMYLTNSLRNAYQPVPCEFVPGGKYIFNRKKQVRYDFDKINAMGRFCTSLCSRSSWVGSRKRHQKQLDQRIQHRSLAQVHTKKNFFSFFLTHKKVADY
jgi:hypothetical protein